MVNPRKVRQNGLPRIDDLVSSAHVGKSIHPAITKPMKTQIDIKSALVGILIGILAVLAVGAATNSNQVGRYQISSGDGFSVMVDTQTGKAWGVVHAPTSNSAIRNTGNFFDAK